MIKISFYWRAGLMFVGLLALHGLTFAQVPDAGALQQQLQREVDQERPTPAPEKFLKKKERELASPKPGEALIDVKGFKVTGITLITEQQALEVLKPYTNRQLTVTQIKEAANEVALLYQQIGREAGAEGAVIESIRNVGYQFFDELNVLKA